MDLDRAAMKASLLLERKQLRNWQGQKVYLCVCDLCGRANPTDLHECLVSRRPTQMNDALQHAILTSPFNVNLLCNNCNVRLAEVVRWRRHLVGHNILRYGAGPIITWLRGLPMTDVTEYVLLVEDVAREMAAPPNHEIEGAPYHAKPKPPKVKVKKPRKSKTSPKEG